MSAEQTIPIAWFTDADNTLWDTDTIFRSAQLGLLLDVEVMVSKKCTDIDRLAYVRRIDQGIAGKHHQGLRYPSELLAQAVAYALRNDNVNAAISHGLTGGSILSSSDLTKIISQYKSNLESNPELRAGVHYGLSYLYEGGIPVTLVTEGQKDRISRLLVHHSLEMYVTSIVEATKTKELFSRLSKLYPKRECWMIGDQVDRDIEPARLAGMKAIYFPGGFLPSLSKPVDSSVPQVSSYDQGAHLVMSGSSTDKNL